MAQSSAYLVVEQLLLVRAIDDARILIDPDSMRRSTAGAPLGAVFAGASQSSSTRRLRASVDVFDSSQSHPA